MPRGKRTVKQRVKNANGKIQEITVQLDDTPAERTSPYLVDPKDAPENQPAAKAGPSESKPAASPKGGS